jgi:two-component system, NarL family, sensor histidine kinase DesK
MTDVTRTAPKSPLPPTDSRMHPGVMDRLATEVRRTYRDAIIDEYGPRRWMRARIGAAIGLLFLTWPVRHVVGSERPVAYKILILIGVVVYAACFITVIWRNTPRMHGNRAPAAIGLSLVVGATLSPVYGLPWLAIMTSFTIAMLLFNAPTRLWPYILVLLPLAEFVAARWAFDDSSWDGVTMALQAALIGAIQAAFYLQVAAKVELRRIRADLARLAVTEERLRISRDLHDILGQQLSAVSLKAELAARLVTRDPERAAAEMIEVAAVARAALADVRETVAGYRQMSLCGETETAKALLTAARVNTVIETCELAPGLDACGAWLVREAVTNVIRHAGASRCEISATATDGSVVVEVRDNGGTPSSALTFGNGLTGLSERVEGEGGVLWAGRENGWFVVRATFAPAPAPQPEPVGRPVLLARAAA